MNELSSGVHINFTERKAVMHHVFHMPKRNDFKARHNPQGDTIIEEAHSALDRIARLSEDVIGRVAYAGAL